MSKRPDRVGVGRALLVRSSAERSAAEAFVYVMRRARIREHDLATEAWISTGGATCGANGDVVRRYRMAPPFWPLTLDPDCPVMTGYGVNTHAVVIRYAQRDVPLKRTADGFTSVRTEFGPGCRDLFERASATIPAFVCESVAPDDARRIVAEFLLDALVSHLERRGPLIATGPTPPPPSTPQAIDWNARDHGDRVHENHQQGAARPVRL